MSLNSANGPEYVYYKYMIKGVLRCRNIRNDKQQGIKLSLEEVQVKFYRST